MASDSPFAPYRLAPGSLPDEGARNARLVGAGPLMVGPDLPLPPALLAEALACVETGQAATEAEACRGADGALAGNPAAPRACLVGERHRLGVAEAALRAVLQAGYAGAILEQPDAPLVEGLLGAGFCPDCQREFQRRLVRKYGEQFQPVDFLALARTAVANASSALSFATLPFGRDFWRFRHESLERAVRAHVRGARDAAREAGRPFTLGGRFAALGPSQLGAARLLDAAIFPVTLSGYPVTGRFELLRGALRRRAVAVEPPDDAPPAAWLRLASLGAPYGIGVAGLQPGREAGAVLAGIRALIRRRGRARRGPQRVGAPGRGRRPLLGRGRRLERRPPPARRGVGARGAHPAAAPGDGGAAPLRAGRRDPAGAGRRRVALAPRGGRDRQAQGGPAAHLRRPRRRGQLRQGGRRPVPARAARRHGQLAGAAGRRGPLHPAGSDVHLATAWPDRARRVTLRLPVTVTGGARKARFFMSDGTEARLRCERSGEAAVLVELPTFTGYAVLTPER